jgi:tetratricopeptide (TPR) repeat protein
VRGLLRKALTLHTKGRLEDASKPAELPGEDPEAQDESSGISAEEKRQIADQIDRLMADNRIEVSPENLSYVSRRNGALLPLFSNIAIFAAAIIALLVISLFLNHQENSIAVSGSAILTTESKLIAALKQETDQQLQQRDRAIVDAQNKLSAVSREKEQLRGQADSIIRAREQELKDEFDRTIAAERDRLEKQGTAAASVGQKMKTFEDAEKRRLAPELERARQRAETDLAAKQQALVSAETQYQGELEAARQERLRLQDESRQKEEELQKETEKAQQAEGEGTRVGAELARLRNQQDQERLVNDQITAGYAQVNVSLQENRYDQALDGLASLRKILDNDSVAALPAILRRRAVEIFLIGSLEEMIRTRQAGTSAEGSSLFKDVTEMVKHGDELSHSGNVQGARAAYEAAIEKIPPLSSAFGKLQDMKNVEVTSVLRQANVFYQAGNFQATIDRYQQSVGLLLNDKTLARQLTDSLTNAGYHLLAADALAQLGRLKTDEQKRQDLSARLRDIGAQYKAYVALVPRSSASDPGSPESLATLLQAKILLRQVLDTDPVRSQYPDLAAKTERYIDAVSAKAKNDGRKEALDVLDSLLGKIQSGDKTSAQSLARMSVSGGEQDPFLRLLDRLQALLQ